MIHVEKKDTDISLISGQCVCLNSVLSLLFSIEIVELFTFAGWTPYIDCATFASYILPFILAPRCMADSL